MCLFKLMSVIQIIHHYVGVHERIVRYMGNILTVLFNVISSAAIVVFIFSIIYSTLMIIGFSHFNQNFIHFFSNF